MRSAQVLATGAATAATAGPELLRRVRGSEPASSSENWTPTKIANVTDLLAALRQQEPGKTVGLTVRRGSNDQKLTVTLGDLAQQ